MKLTDNLAMLSIQGSSASVHPVLLWDVEHLVLIDAGFPGQLDIFREAMAAYGKKPEELTHILLTHQDWDHIGCMRELLAVAPQVKVYAHAAEASSIRGDEPPTKVVAMFAKREQTPENKAELEQRVANYSNYTVRVDVELQDAEVIPVCGGILAIHTPGHTLGHLCFFMERDKVLMTGDTVGVSDGKLTGCNPVHTPDMALGAISNQKLAQVPAAMLVAYHGGLFQGDIPAAIRGLGQ